MGFGLKEGFGEHEGKTLAFTGRDKNKKLIIFKLLAIIHVHPDHSEFSSDDKEHSKLIGVPNYIIRNGSGTYFYFKGISRRRGSSIGEEFKWYEIKNHVKSISN